MWLQVSYTPILDANPRLLKVVKCVTDITERRRLTQQLDELVGRIRHAVGEVTVSARDSTNGNASLSQPVEEQAASLEEIAGSMKEMTEAVQRNSPCAATRYRRAPGAPARSGWRQRGVGRVPMSNRLQRQTMISPHSLCVRKRDPPQSPHAAPAAATLARILMPLH